MIILAGGFGTRLRGVYSAGPKPLAPVLGRPFLEWQVQSLLQQGYRTFWFSTGYMGEQIASHPWSRLHSKAEFRFFQEESPLGTGGATAHILRQTGAGQAWVVNGDTLLENPLPTPDLEDWELAAYVTIPTELVFDAQPNLVTDGRFVVSEGADGNRFDGGAVLLSARALEGELAAFVPSPPPAFSMHRLLKRAMELRRVGYRVLNGRCYDMGTPERLGRLETFLSTVSQMKEPGHVEG